MPLPGVHASGSEVIVPELLSSRDEGERRLIQAVVTLARSLRDERDRLAKRLHEVELELSVLASKLLTREDAADALGPLSGGGIEPRADRPRRPSRTRG